MATTLEIDNLGLPDTPYSAENAEAVAGFLEDVHNYLAAVRRDTQKLRDVIDSHHP